MAGSRCAVCGREEFLPYRCKLCSLPHCLDHRLPENHSCAGLAAYRTRVHEGRLPPPGSKGDDEARVRVRRGGAIRMRFHRLPAFARRSATHMLLTTVLLMALLQVAGGLMLAALTGSDPGALSDAMVLGLHRSAGMGNVAGNAQLLAESLIAKPWSLVTNLFAHASIFHLLFNAMFLYFFGLELEHRTGRRKLLGLFFAAGILASVGQVVVFGGGVLGASGALMGLLGTLVVLAPRMKLSFFFVPMPLWIMTLIYVALDLLALNGLRASAPVANLAHLLGFAVGLIVGLDLKRRGVLLQQNSTWASQRRF